MLQNTSFVNAGPYEYSIAEAGLPEKFASFLVVYHLSKNVDIICINQVSFFFFSFYNSPLKYYNSGRAFLVCTSHCFLCLLSLS